MTQKELKEQYKQMKLPMGIFQVRNTVNGKILVESSINLNTIWNRYRLELGFGSHPNQALQQDWNAHGEAAFVFEVLSELAPEEGVDDRKNLKKLAQMYLDDLQPYAEKGYNCLPKTQ
jgi:hypothetical protein